MTNASYLEINAAQWHRTRLEQLLEHPTGASPMRRFAAFGLLVMRRFAGLLLWGVWCLSYLSLSICLRWFLCTLELSPSPSRAPGWLARPCSATLWQETCSTMSGPSLSRVVALIDMDCFCMPPHTHATPQHTHLCNLPERLPIPASSPHRLRLRTGARLIARGCAVSGGAVQPFPGRWLRQRLGSRLPAR